MPEVEEQLREYWTSIIVAQPPPTVAEVLESAPITERLVDAHHGPSRITSRRQLLAAAVVVLVAGAVTVYALVSSAGDDDTSVTTDAPPAPDNRETEQVDDPRITPDPVDPGGASGLEADEGTETTSPTPTSIAWSRIQDITPVDVVSDGRTFFALADRDTETVLVTSTDGTTWRSVAAVPFDHLDAAWNGRVLSVQDEQRWSEGRFEGSITVHVVEADGTVSESSVVPVIPDRHELFVEGLGVSATFLDREGLVITGSYHLSHAAVVAAAIGIPLQEITGPDAMDDLERLLADAGVDVFGNGSVSETEVRVDGAVATLSDFGLTSQELVGDLGVTLVSSDGLGWEQVDIPAGVSFGEEPVTIDGGIIGGVFDGSLEHVISLSEDGVEWTEVVDLATGQPIPRDGRLLPGPDHALYLASNAAWVVTTEGAAQLVTDGTEFENIDAESVEDSAGWSTTIGDAGVAYLTGFTSGVPQEPHRPRAIVVSTDYKTWTRFSLPDEMISPEGEYISLQISVGAAGVVVWGNDTAWFGELTDDSDPAAVIEDYRVSYNGGDIEEVMTLFTDESVITAHPYADEAAGLAEIRSLQIDDMSAAAPTDAYEVSNIEVSGDTVTWDHVWLNEDGEEWCAEGHSAVVTDGQIVTWTFAPTPRPCGG